MSKVITFSRYFPKGHKSEGKETCFVEKVTRSLLEEPNKSGIDWHSMWVEYLNDYDKIFDSKNLDAPAHYSFKSKLHTIRAGNRWKVGEKFSPRVWIGKPYTSKQFQFINDLEIVRIYDFEIKILDKKDLSGFAKMYINGKEKSADEMKIVATNDGLEFSDFLSWFKYPTAFKGQILCWSNVEY